MTLIAEKFYLITEKKLSIHSISDTVGQQF